jgi:hypothetical protein
MNRGVWTWVSVLVLGLVSPLGGCTSLLRKDAPRVERTLVEAGFRMIPADTPDKVAQLQVLPPYKLVKRVKSGTVRYLYADPANCQCVYIGTAEQYATFKRYISQMSIAEADALEERMETQEQAEAVEDAWDPL